MWRGVVGQGSAQIIKQLFAAVGVPQPCQGLMLDLADTLTRQAELSPTLERVACSAQAKRMRKMRDSRCDSDDITLAEPRALSIGHVAGRRRVSSMNANWYRPVAHGR